MMHNRNFRNKFIKIWTISVAFKYLDAREDLSIQVHPNDELAKRHHSFGKTEMWYIMLMMMLE
jgi:mannose-6-phosphate isomerase class I